MDLFPKPPSINQIINSLDTWPNLVREEFGQRAINVKWFGAKGDGVTDDTAAIQAAIDAAATVGGIVFFPPGSYVVTSTLILPASSVILQGSGCNETNHGTRLKWMGSNNDSVIQIDNYNKIKDIFIYNGNKSTGVTAIDAWGTSGGRSPARWFLEQVQVKGFGTGIAMAYGWYNILIDVVASYCNIGFKVGNDLNNTILVRCATSSCPTGLVVTHISKGVSLKGCCFEDSTLVAIDLTNNKTGGYAHAWNIDACYFENNQQTAILGGTSVSMRNCIINHDYVNYASNPAPGCIEIPYGTSPIEVAYITFSVDIPEDKRIAITADTTGQTHSYGNVLIKGIYRVGTLARVIFNNPQLVLKNILNREGSDIAVIITPLLNANTAQIAYFLPPGMNLYERYRLVACALVVEETIVVGSGFTVRVGKGGSHYDQYVNQTFTTDIPIGTTLLTFIPTNPEVIYETNYVYRYNNSAATSGKYRMMFILAK